MYPIEDSRAESTELRSRQNYVPLGTTRQHRCWVVGRTLLVSAARICHLKSNIAASAPQTYKLYRTGVPNVSARETHSVTRAGSPVGPYYDRKLSHSMRSTMTDISPVTHSSWYDSTAPCLPVQRDQMDGQTATQLQIFKLTGWQEFTVIEEEKYFCTILTGNVYSADAW